MDEDMYLSTAVQLYENGIWTEEIVRKQVLLHAKEKGIDRKTIDEFFDRLFAKKELTIEDKREYLRNAKFSNGEPIYPNNAVDKMSDEHVEKLYAVETQPVKKDASDWYKPNPEPALINENDEKVEKESDEAKLEAMKATFDEKANESLKIEVPKVEETKVFKVPVKVVEKKEEPVIEEIVEEEPKKVKPIPIKVEEEKEEENIPIINFAAFLEQEIEKAKKGNEEVKKETPVEKPKVEASVEKSDDEEVEVIDFGRLAEETNDMFERGELDEPSTEKEYEKVHENMTGSEKDSGVRVVNVSPERLAKLKKNKRKIINYAIKGGIIVAAVLLLHPIESIPLIGGYMYFASKIKEGTFMPKTKLGAGVKELVTSIMNVGLEEDLGAKEGGKTR